MESLIRHFDTRLRQSRDTKIPLFSRRFRMLGVRPRDLQRVERCVQLMCARLLEVRLIRRCVRALSRTAELGLHVAERGVVRP